MLKKILLNSLKLVLVFTTTIIFSHQSVNAADIDGDGIVDSIDNCIYVYNTDQLDSNSDDIGNACECITPFLEFDGESPGDFIGHGTTSAGDVNNDGYDDIIAGSLQHNNGRGRVYVFSGLDGSILYQYDGEGSKDFLGMGVTGVGDLNNDNYDDFAFGAPENNTTASKAGAAYIYSGIDGSLLYDFYGEFSGSGFGYPISKAGDVNNDSIPDIIIGAYFSAFGGFLPGNAYVYSGADGTLIHKFTGEAGGDRFGVQATGIGDINQDMHDDLIIGAAWSDSGGAIIGRSYIYSGIDGSRMFMFEGENPGDNFGLGSASAGDVNFDSIPDFIIGARWNDEGGEDAGKVYVYSGKDTTLLYSYIGASAGDNLGLKCNGVGDINNDNHSDFAISTIFHNNTGAVYLYSGIDGKLMHKFNGEAAGDSYGTAVTSAGDVNNDGSLDLVIGSMLNNSSGGVNSGKVYVYSLADFDNDFIPSDCDNCPENFNPDQLDTNNDGKGDACCCIDIRGNVDGDALDEIDISDLVFIVDFIFTGGIAPPCLEEANIDGDVGGDVDISDLVFLVDFIFTDGPSPGVCS